ncbi:hypothetical protein BHE74_00048609 [Ensete ventricosum]|nr:hypothetical protein BHE74_00048609 [Ensete ventricosum]
MSDLSSLLFGGPEGCPRGCSARGRFDSSRLPATSVSAAMYWCAHFSISDIVSGGHSINDQKNLDGLSLIKNVWMVREGWTSGTSQTYEANRPTNWERDSSGLAIEPVQQSRSLRELPQPGVVAPLFQVEFLDSWPRVTLSGEMLSEEPLGYRLYKLGQVGHEGLHHASQRLNLVGEVEKGLSRDDEWCEVGRR